MPPVVMRVQLFRDRTEAERARSQKGILWLLESLCRINALYLRTHPNTPNLYDSGVRYVAEVGSEIWQDIPTVLQEGIGDCEDLAAWRCAELNVREGIAAKPYITWRRTAGGLRYHAVVKLPDGRIEDPSAALGMRGPVVSRPVYISGARRAPRELSMFRGKLNIYRENGQWKGDLELDTPAGPIAMNASADIAGDEGAARQHVSERLFFGASFAPPEALVGKESAALALQLFRKSQSAKPATREKAKRILERVRAQAEAGDQGALDLTYAIARLAQAEQTRRKYQQDDRMWVGLDWRLTEQNLARCAEKEAGCRRGAVIWRHLQSGNAEQRERARRMLAQCEKNEDAFCLWYVRKAAQCERARRDEAAGLPVVVGFSFAKFKKKVKKAAKGYAKKSRKAERNFRKWVTDNKALVSMIPVYGPYVVAGAELLNKVDNGDPDAIEQVEATAALAAQGNPEAQRAMQTLATAQAMRSEIQGAQTAAIYARQTGTFAQTPEGQWQAQQYAEREAKKRAIAEMARQTGYSPAQPLPQAWYAPPAQPPPPPAWAAPPAQPRPPAWAAPPAQPPPPPAWAAPPAQPRPPQAPAWWGA